MSISKAVIMSGFKEDCEQLLSLFEKADDIRFETFCEIWKSMKFSLIFTGRPCCIELLEFCEEALNMCKQYLLAPSRFKERIGGLYLLYGIYYKMPIDTFKIRMTSDNWRIIMELHTEMKEAEHLDANYILCKLIADNAFHFCICDLEFGLEKHYREKNTKCYNPYSVLSTLKDLADKDQILSNIDELSEAYDKIKQTLKPDANLEFYNPKIAKEIINNIRDFEEKKRSEQRNMLENGASTSKKEQRKCANFKCNRNKNKVRVLLEEEDYLENDYDDDNALDIDECDTSMSEEYD